MLDRLKRYFCSTTFGDQAKTEVAVWLHTILLILVVAAAVVALLLSSILVR